MPNCNFGMIETAARCRSHDFQTIVTTMHQQPWWNELGFDEQTLSTTVKQERPLFIVYVTRK